MPGREKEEETALSVRRIMMLVTVAALMAAMVVVLAMPALAAEPVHPEECYFEQGKTYCTEKEVIGSGSELLGLKMYTPEFGGYPGPLVTETTYKKYTDYRITETTYAGKSTHVLDQTTRTEREETVHTNIEGGC